ncbi:hypothetical protein QQF64_028765, partial [Cirrhinus molitorella]
MEKGYEILSNNTYTNTVSVNITEESECFICRDVGLVGEDPLRTFCDCKNLVAHHSCLLTWIKKGLGQEERLRCSVCNAETDLQAGFLRVYKSEMFKFGLRKGGT